MKIYRYINAQILEMFFYAGGGGGYPTPRETSAGVLTLRSSGPAQPLPPHLQQARRTHGFSPEALRRHVSRYLRTVE